MECKKVSIEFAHIYTDETISYEQTETKRLVINYIQRIRDTHEIYLYNMIDDYNPQRHILNIETFKSYLQKDIPYKINFFYESEMMKYASQTLEFLNNKDKNSYERYISKNNIFPCSLLALTFYLIRLGVINIGENIKAHEIVNFLGYRFFEIENYIIKLLKRSKLSGVEKHVRTVYVKENNVSRKF